MATENPQAASTPPTNQVPLLAFAPTHVANISQSISLSVLHWNTKKLLSPFALSQDILLRPKSSSPFNGPRALQKRKHSFVPTMLILFCLL